jgi:hypothetical protein
MKSFKSYTLNLELFGRSKMRLVPCLDETKYA